MEELKNAVRHVSLRGEIIWPSGTAHLLTGEDILSLSISEGVNDGLLLGACPAAGLKLTLSDPGGQFLYLGEKRGANAAAGAQVKLHLRVRDAAGVWQERPLGHFYVTDMTNQENAVGCTLQGVDALGYLFEGAFADTLIYPATLGQIAEAIARQAGIEVNTDFPGAGGGVSALPDWENMSLRRALSCVCAAAGCFAHVDRQGRLRIKPVRDENIASPYAIQAKNALIRQYGEISFGPLNALRIETHGAPRGAADSVLLLTQDTGISENTLYTLQNNPLFAYGAAHTRDLGAQALENLRGLAMTRALLKWQGDPEVTLGRYVCMTDKRNVPTYTVVTRQTLQFDQGFSMQTDCTVRTPFSQGAGVVISPSGQISGGSISGEINGALIKDGTLGVTALTAHSITGHYIAANAVATEHLSADSVQSEHIQAGAVNADHIESKTITADKLQSGLITAESGLIGEGAIGTAQIANGSITDAKIVELTANKINAGTLSVERLVITGSEESIVFAINEANGTAQLSQTTIDGGSLTERSITADKIVAGSITSDEIAANAITANKILAGAVTTDKLSAMSVTADKLAAESVTANKLASDVGRNLDLSSNESVKASVVSGVQNSAATLTAEEFSLSFDGKNVMEVDADSAVFDVDTLTATGQIIGNVPNTQGEYTVTVPSGVSIQRVLDSLGKNLVGAVDINVSGYHGENVNIAGFFGAGTLTMRFLSGAVLEGTVYVNDCASRMYIYGPDRNQRVIRGGDYGIQASNCAFVYISNVGMMGKDRTVLGTNEGSQGIRALDGANVQVYNCLIEKCGQCFHVSRAILGIHNCVGGISSTDAASVANARWLVISPQSNGIAIVSNGTIPLSKDGVYQEDGVLHCNTDSVVATASPDTAGEVANQSVTMTPSSAESAVYGTSDGSGGYVKPWGYYTSVYQGKNQSAGGYMFGLWLFAEKYAEFFNAISGKVIQSATVTIKRSNAYGVDGSLVKLFYHGLLSVSDSQQPSAILADTGLSARVDRGKSVTFALNSDLIAKLQNGTIKGFGLSSAGSTDLMQFEGTVCDVTVVF